MWQFKLETQEQELLKQIQNEEQKMDSLNASLKQTLHMLDHQTNVCIHHFMI